MFKWQKCLSQSGGRQRETPRELRSEVKTTTGRPRTELWTLHPVWRSPHALGEAAGPAGSPWWLSSWDDMLLRGLLVVVGGLLHDDWTQTQHLQVLICTVWQTLAHDLEQRRKRSVYDTTWQQVDLHNQPLHWRLVLSCFLSGAALNVICAADVSNTETHTNCGLFTPFPPILSFQWVSRSLMTQHKQVRQDRIQVTGYLPLLIVQFWSHRAHQQPLTAIFSVIADFCLSLRSCSMMDSWSWLRICVAA